MEGELKAVVMGACLFREEETSGGALAGTVVRWGFGEGFNGGESFEMGGEALRPKSEACCEAAVWASSSL